MKAKAIKFYKKRGWVLPALGWWIGYVLWVLLLGLILLLTIGFLMILAIVEKVTKSKRVKKIADKLAVFIGKNIEVNDEI